MGPDADGRAGGVGAGEALVLGSALSWAVYSVAGRPLLGEFPPLVVTCYAAVAGTLMLLPFALGDMAALTALAADPRALGLVFFLGFFGTALAFLWYYEGIAAIGTVNTAMYMNLIPVFGVIAAACILRETPDPALLGGGALVLLGLVLVNRTNAAPAVV